MSGIGPVSRQQPAAEELARLRASYRRRRLIAHGGALAMFVIWIVVIYSQRSESVIVATWGALAVFGLIATVVVWRCPGCGTRFGRSWRVERCPHCWLELEPRSDARPSA